MCERIAPQQTGGRKNRTRLRITGHATSIQRKNAVFPKLDTCALRPAVEASLFRGIAHTLDSVIKRGGVHTQGCTVLYDPALRIIFMGGNRKFRDSLSAECLYLPFLFVLWNKGKRQLSLKMGTGFHHVLCPGKNERYVVTASGKLRYEPCIKVCCRQRTESILYMHGDLLQNGERAFPQNLTDLAHRVRKRSGIYREPHHAAFLLGCFSSTVCIRIVRVEKSV